MGGKQSIADAERGHLTEAEMKISKGIFREMCKGKTGTEKGCSYESFLIFCEKLHPLLTQFLIEFYFGNDGRNKLEKYREFISIYSHLVRGNHKEKTKMMEVLLLQLNSDAKKPKGLGLTKEQTPVTILLRKLVPLDIRYNIDEHTFKMRQENYLRGLICTYIKMEHASESEEFNSWRKVKSRFSIGDIDKLAVTLQANMALPSSADDMTKWVAKWKTINLLHSVVYGSFFGLEEFQNTHSLYPLCDCKHRHNVCLMDMCSIIHINSHLPSKFRHCWRLLYSSVIHGVNFRLVVDRILHEGANIVVIRDKNNHVFGGFASEAWRPSSRFYGNFTSFLFRLHPNLDVYEVSGKDENYQFMNFKGQHRGFGMGKGPMNLYGWWIEPERLRGSCALSCSTFQGLPVLAGTQYFEIHSFEIWGVDDSPVKRKQRPDVKFHTYAESLIADSNIDSAGQVLLRRTGRRKYTDGYGTAKAVSKWEEDDPHKVQEIDPLDKEAEEDELDDEESDSDFDVEVEANKDNE